MEYKIANTTKSQRIELVKEAFGILITGDSTVPTDSALNYMKEYINGVTELEDVQEKIIKMYRNEG